MCCRSIVSSNDAVIEHVDKLNFLDLQISLDMYSGRLVDSTPAVVIIMCSEKPCSKYIT